MCHAVLFTFQYDVWIVTEHELKKLILINNQKN